MDSVKVRRESDLSFWAWLYNWRWTPHAVAYLFCIILIGGLIPGIAQMVVGYDEITYGWGILLVMIWLIPLTLYGFYKWKDKQEFRA